MKLTIEFETKTPADAIHVLRVLGHRLMMEFNPNEWKRPDVIEQGIFMGEDTCVATIRMEKP